MTYTKCLLKKRTELSMKERDFRRSQNENQYKMEDNKIT